MNFTCHSGITDKYGPTVSVKVPLEKTPSQQMTDMTELELRRQQRV